MFGKSETNINVVVEEKNGLRDYAMIFFDWDKSIADFIFQKNSQKKKMARYFIGLFFEGESKTR